MSLPPPSVLLGNPRFPEWYPGQEELFNRSLDWYSSPARFLGMAIPTGSGKSVSALLLSRYSGARTIVLTATKGLQNQYCLSPETRVLHADLQWREIASLREGDQLLAFDEQSVGRNHRKWRSATVSKVQWFVRPCYRLLFDDGSSVICSSDHMWLVAAGRRDGTSRFWRRTENLRVGGKFASKVVRFLDVWNYDVSDRTAGYLAGAYDGEGSLTQRKARRVFRDKHEANGVDVNLSFSQNNNGMLRTVKEALTSLGFAFNEQGHGAKDKCLTLTFRSRADVLRFLGQVRPARLLERFNPDVLGSVFNLRACAVVSREFLGDRVVVAATTTTGTLLAEGLASHNCGDIIPLGGVVVMGQNNFPCLLVHGLRADEGPCHDGLSCAVKENCPYRVQLSRAMRSPLVITNYAYWLAQNNFSTGLGDVGLLVCDEGHLAFGAMEGYLTIFLSRLDIEPCGIRFPAAADQWSVWQNWATSSLPVVQDNVSHIESDIRALRNSNQPIPGGISHAYRSAKSVAAKLERLSSVGEDWVIQPTKYGYRFVPRWVSNYSGHLFGNTPKVVLMSAILSHRTCDYLGVPSDGSRTWLEMGSQFPPENTQIWHVPTARINYRTDDYGSTIWVTRIDQLIQRRMDRKGIVFTVSYERARLLLSRSIFKHLMVTHGTSDVVQAIEKFKKMPAPAVLVSPSVTTGYDFPAVTGVRYLVIGKIPYPDTKDPVTHARHQDDKDWSSYAAMETFIQEAGRATRSPDDRVEVFCVDDSFKWWYWKYRDFAPGWFQARVRGSLERVPDPLV